MAQRPTFPSPYLSTIDAEEDNDFSCLINGMDVITGYKLTIYSTTNTVTYKDKTDGAYYTNFQKLYENSGSVSDKTEGLPVYGSNGNDSYLVINVPKGTLSNRRQDILTNEVYVVADRQNTALSEECKKAGFTIPDTTTGWVDIYWIESGEYKWQVELTDENGGTALSREYYFTCYKSVHPTINGDSVISSFKADFSGNYPPFVECDENSCYSVSKMISHRFILTSDDGKTLKDTGEVYSSCMAFSYDMFLKGNYTLLLEVECEGHIKQQAELEITVDYKNAVSVVSPVLSTLRNENALLLDFSNNRDIQGEIIDYGGESLPPEYIDTDGDGDFDAVCIPENTEIKWEKITGFSDSLDIPEDDFTIDLMVNLPYTSYGLKTDGDYGVILQLEGDSGIIGVTFDGHKLTLKKNDVLVDSQVVYDSTVALPTDKNTMGNDSVYYFDFTSRTEYLFEESDMYMLQNPMNVGWWLIRVTPNSIRAKRITEAITANVE